MLPSKMDEIRVENAYVARMVKCICNDGAAYLCFYCGYYSVFIKKFTKLTFPHGISILAV